MQTFLPYPDFGKSVRCLDYRRLGKQRVEAKQLIDLLEGDTSNNWRNHPACRMWEGHVESLKLYCNYCILEWISRGYKNNMLMYVIDAERLTREDYPSWFGRKDFHDAHKSNLLRKNSEYYSRFKWGVPNNLPYKWK